MVLAGPVKIFDKTKDMLTRSQYIAQAFVFGDNKPYNVTLIVPDLAEVCAN
jgi:long-subunit acyl-CoA synthetase (AMP-forming)